MRCWRGTSEKHSRAVGATPSPGQPRRRRHPRHACCASSTSTRRSRSVVSVWTDGHRRTTCVQSFAPAGREHRRLAGRGARAAVPPDVPDGQRADTLAQVAFLRRPADLAYDEWRAPLAGSAHADRDRDPGDLRLRPEPGDRQAHRRAPGRGRDRRGALPERGDARHPRVLRQRWRRRGARTTPTRLMESVATMGADRDIDVVPTSRVHLRPRGRVAPDVLETFRWTALPPCALVAAAVLGGCSNATPSAHVAPTPTRSASPSAASSASSWASSSASPSARRGRRAGASRRRPCPAAGQGPLPDDRLRPRTVRPGVARRRPQRLRHPQRRAHRT